jgi:NDP-sugar pyrophosphorylase family protein
MAGLGSRFQQAGFTTPKPLIEVLGRPMYAWAAESLPLDKSRRLIFILLAARPEYRALSDDIRQRYARHRPIVLTVPELTAGQAVTVLRAKELIDRDEPLLIHNADTAFEVNHRWVEDALVRGADGALLVFASQEKRWSYSREDARGWVVEVREKEVISPWASTGTYWFRKGSEFVRLANSRLRAGRKEATEYYVAPLYNDLLAGGARVKNYPIDRLFCFGTPEELAATLQQIQGV